MEPIEYLWKDRKRFLGLPLSFTRYRLSEDRLFCETGFFNIKSDEVLLYRVRDLRLTLNLAQRIFGVGTICVVSSDKSIPHLDLKNIKNPRMVKELIHSNVEAAQNASAHQSGAPPMAKWLTAPVKAVKAIINTLVPTAVFSSYPKTLVRINSIIIPPPAPTKPQIKPTMTPHSTD